VSAEEHSLIARVERPRLLTRVLDRDAQVKCVELRVVAARRVGIACRERSTPYDTTRRSPCGALDGIE
jgi:hypothetical protein